MKIKWLNILLLFLLLHLDKADIEGDIKLKLGKSHFSPLVVVDEIFTERKGFSLQVLAISDLINVKTPSKSFFTSLLPSSSTPKSLDLWNEIIAEANRVKQSYSPFFDSSLTTCYITNIQSALKHALDEISDGRVKRNSDSDSSNQDSSTTTTSTTETSTPDPYTEAKINEQVKRVIDLVRKLDTHYSKPKKSSMQIKASTYHAIKIILACWVNNRHRTYLVHTYEQVLKHTGVAYSETTKSEQEFMPLNELRRQLLELIVMSVSGTLRLDFTNIPLSEPEKACTVDLENLTYEELRSVQDEQDIASFCTSTPQVCIEKEPKMNVRKKLLDFGLGEADATKLISESQTLADVYSKAMDIKATQNTYTLTKTVNYGEMVNIDTTKLSNKFKEGYKSEDAMFNILSPILNELKFLNIVYATELKYQDKPLSAKFFKCAALQDKTHFSRQGNKLYYYLNKFENKNVFYPLPFCAETCKILVADPYVELDDNKFGVISTSSDAKYGYVSKITQNKPTCSMIKKPSDICIFKDISYAKQISILDLFVYHCTKSEGCNYFNEGIIVSKGFITISEFNLNFIDTENDSNISFFPEENEILLKGLIYSAISGVVLVLFAAAKKFVIFCYNNARSMATCSCCKNKTENTRRSTRYTPANTQEPVFISPQVNPNQE